ncbi:MAG: dTDP-4-amino-4,6-dideoxygalactose transaminase, partial [Candidatus Omnitrophota bacterium]|nr:dTDP-4-amino-4,6-dideoxygalactose transaminase [Candidatus Omnitrophota bacterium]
NAFVLRGARIIFVDIRPDTMNIDEKLIEPAITQRTKVIVPVHYGSVGCEMDSIMAIAKKHKLLVIEDAAQGVMAKYKGRYLGTIGHIGCYSFHETKNYTAGEGGAIVLSDERLVERAEIVREKGTDRVKFFNGEVDKYTWVDIGSSYIPGEICAAFLYAQLEAAKEIYEDRMKSWNLYYKALKPLADAGFIELPYVPRECEHSAHLFYIKVKDLAARSGLIDKFRKNDILSIFHYVPLHSSKSGIRYGRFHGYDRWTTKESERLVRLPMYCRLSVKDIEEIVDIVADFYGSKSKIESVR